MLAAPASAERIAYYRVGAAAVSPGSLEGPGTYGAGLGLNAGVSVPFRHRLALTLDLAHDRLAWERSSEPTAATIRLERDDLAVDSALLGLDIAYRRGNAARPLVSLGLGAARVRPGAAELADMITGTRTRVEPGPETVFAASVAAGVRVRLASHTAARIQLGWLGLGRRQEFTHVVPVRLQLEF